MNQNNHTPRAGFKSTIATRVLRFYRLFFLLWGIILIGGCTQPQPTFYTDCMEICIEENDDVDVRWVLGDLTICDNLCWDEYPKNDIYKSCFDECGSNKE